MELSSYLKVFSYPEKQGYALFFSTLTCSTALLSESVIGSLTEENMSGTYREQLVSLGILVEDAERERAGMYGIFNKANDESTHLNAIVVLNLDCNLACRYCYEGTLKGKHYMSRETADALLVFLKNRAVEGGKRTINLDFYGGEPLLSASIMSYISENLVSFAQDERLEYSFNIVTNGTLLSRKKALKLKELGLRSAKVTIDGPRDNHDRNRPFRSGKGSFDRIVENIKETHDIVNIGVGGNFTRENYRTFPRLLDFLGQQCLTPGRISGIKFDPVTKTHGPQAPADFREGCETISEGWLVEASLFLRQEILKRGYRTQKIVLSPCMIDIRDRYVINYDGTIYKCPGLIGQKDFEIGNVRVAIKDYSVSHNLDLWKRVDCIRCAYLPLCFGGCRFMKYVRDGDISDVDCKKAYYDVALETLIKQEVKYRSSFL
jgi:uncharacterized protein